MNGQAIICKTVVASGPTGMIYYQRMSEILKPAIKAPTSPKRVAEPDNNGAASSSTVAVIAMNMAWELAVVVIVPILGGHYLDTKLGGSTPIWTIIGLVVSAVAMIMVVRNTITSLNTYMEQNTPKKDKI